MHIYIIGLTSPSSTISSDMSTTVSEPSSTISSDMPTIVSEVPPPPVTTSSAGLSQEIVIAIVISSALAACMLILLVVLVVRQCQRKNKETPAKNKENHFANKQNNFTKNDDLKSYKPRKSKLLEKRNTKLGSTSLDKKLKDAHLENFARKERMHQHYPQTTDYWNSCGNQLVFDNSYNEGNMMFYGNRHDNYLRPHSRPNNRMLYQSHYPEYPGHNEEMFQYNRADNLYRGQQMNQRPHVALYDMNIIDDKQDENRSFKGRSYENNWDLLY